MRKTQQRKKNILDLQVKMLYAKILLVKKKREKEILIFTLENHIYRKIKQVHI